jgi:hypothetical protein
MAGYKNFNHTKNPKEKEFHDKFIELFGDYNKIAEIISSGVYPYYINGNSEGKVTVYDRAKVITTIQWLGSKEGHKFLKYCGYKKK